MSACLNCARSGISPNNNSTTIASLLTYTYLSGHNEIFKSKQELSAKESLSYSQNATNSTRTIQQVFCLDLGCVVEMCRVWDYENIAESRIMKILSILPARRASTITSDSIATPICRGSNARPLPSLTALHPTRPGVLKLRYVYSQ